MSISYKLKELRNSKGITQEDLARDMNIPLGTYRNYEQGLREMNGHTLIQFANYYGVSTDFILGRENNLKTLENSKMETHWRGIPPGCNELAEICQGLNDAGITALISYARFLYEQPQNKKGAESPQDIAKQAG